jgi:dihydroorotate dehydrogenase electron transfer subunit
MTLKVWLINLKSKRCPILTENTIQMIKISKIINDCRDIKTLIFKNPNALKPKPGQFAMIWVPGVDEIPMSISACDDDANWAITVKDIGDCTHALHGLTINDYIGVRGPLGNYFEIPIDRNRNIIIVGGGIGMAPLRFFMNELYNLDYQFKVIQGAKEGNDLIYIDEFSHYNPKSTELHFCTDDGSYGEEGSTIDIFEKLINDYMPKELNNTTVYSCGPEIMLYKLFQICVSHDIKFYVSLERIMRCGCGLCGLCALDPLGLLVCADGPIFSSSELMKLEDFGKHIRDFSGRKIPSN